MNPLLGMTVGSCTSSCHPGDLFVYDARSTIRVIHVQDVTPQEVQLLLLTATPDLLDREGYDSWISWFDHGYPEAASKERVRITLHPFGVECSDNVHSWIVSLLQLQLTPIPSDQRRRAGPRPLPGELDFRPIWNPSLVVDGVATPTVCSAYSTLWPHDGSEIANKTLYMYFTDSIPFPVWIETADSAHHIRLIDSHKPSQ